MTPREQVTEGHPQAMTHLALLLLAGCAAETIDCPDIMAGTTWTIGTIHEWGSDEDCPTLAIDTWTAPTDAVDAPGHGCAYAWEGGGAEAYAEQPWVEVDTDLVQFKDHGRPQLVFWGRGRLEDGAYLQCSMSPIAEVVE